jgi:hypothetical protein
MYGTLYRKINISTPERTDEAKYFQTADIIEFGFKFIGFPA